LQEKGPCGFSHAERSFASRAYGDLSNTEEEEEEEDYKLWLYSQPCFVVKQLVERVGIGLHKFTGPACQFAVVVTLPTPSCSQLHHTKALSGAGCIERF